MPDSKPSQRQLAALFRALEDKEPHPSPSFSWGAIVNLGGIPLITAMLVVAGTWAVMQSTVARNVEEIRAEKEQREKMRESFMASQGRLIEVLGKIDSRLSVTEKQQELGNRQLEKLNDVIGGGNSRRPAR